MEPPIKEFIDALERGKQELRGTAGWASPMVWRERLASQGIAGLDLPRRVGGGGLSARQMVDIFALCGSFNLNLRDVPGGGHSRILVESGQRRFDPVLANVAAGKEYLAIAITEETAGSDLHGLETTARPTSEGYELNGRKYFIARLAEASQAIVFARVDRQTPTNGLSAFLVPLDTPGLTRVSEEGMGLDAVSWGGLCLEGVKIPASARIGGEGQGFSLFKKHFTYWRVAMAAAAIGCARGAMDQAVRWLRERQAFGGPVGRFTHLQQELARHTSHLQMAWLLVAAAAERIDSGLPAVTEAAMAKAEAVEIALEAVDWTVRAHGAKGYSRQLDLEQRLRDLMGLRIADGTTDVLRGQVARAILGDDLYDMSLGRASTHALESDKSSQRRFW